MFLWFNYGLSYPLPTKKNRSSRWFYRSYDDKKLVRHIIYNFIFLKYYTSDV